SVLGRNDALLTRLWSHFCFIFFFQAEDGIRDPLVTGVQTCALPISFIRRGRRARAAREAGLSQRPHPLRATGDDHLARFDVREQWRGARADGVGLARANALDRYGKIGRASGRERVEEPGGAMLGEVR